MSDEWLKEAERRGDEAHDFQEWIDKNTDWIVAEYGQKVSSIDDVPDDFIEDLYNDAGDEQ